MKFKAEKKNENVFFKLSEKNLDAGISSTLKAEFLILCTNDVKNMYIDLSEVVFCDSSGLSALLIAQRHSSNNEGKTVLSGCTENVMKLLKISKLDRVFEIAENLDDYR